MVNNPKMPFYVVQWVKEPGRAEIDGEEDVNGHTYTWNVADYLCRAVRLEILEDGRNWYSRDATRRQYIVYLFGFACFLYIPVFLNHVGKRDSTKLMARYIRSTFVEHQKQTSKHFQGV